MSRDDLIAAFEAAKQNKTDIYVAVTIPGQNDVEYIINKNHSLDNKLAYYCKAYDEECVHCMNDQIKIVGAGCIDFYMGE
jgi:hypothetical protein